MFREPRHYQIAVLSCLLLYGVTRLHFDVRLPNVIAILATALLTQVLGAKLTRTRIDLRSPWISSLSLCLLLRTHDPLWGAVAAVISIGSKFVLRS
ncbi:MAG: hypothetical protein U0527_12735 [Candidatus Eisenbacteria bacterium]